MAHLCPVLRRSEQEQDGVEVRFLRHDAVLPQEVGENAGMDAEIGVAAVDRVDPGRGKQQLARVDEVLVVGIAGEGVPAVLGMELEEADIVGDFIGRVVLPVAAIDLRRHEWTDQGAGFQDQLAGVDAELHAVSP